MAATIIATVGGSTSNSYVTLAEAEVIALTILAAKSTSWDAAATDDIKNRALIQATRDIDSLNLSGTPYYTGLQGTSTYQALHFPTDENVNNSAPFIPTDVQDAQVFQACYLLRNSAAATATADKIATGITETDTGHYMEKLNGSKASRVSSDASEILGSFVSSEINIFRG